MKSRVIAVIPALNEEKTIGRVLSSVNDYVDEIIVIDDGSKDNTAKISGEYASVIKHSKNRGYDNSLNDGFKLAKSKGADIIITLDADGQHLADDISNMVNPIINKEADVVVGKRPYKARFMEHIFANFGKKKGITDPLCGMKAYKTEVYKDVGFFDCIKSIGTQLVFVAFKKGYKIKEIPIKLKKRKDSPRFGKRLKANFKLFCAFMRLKRYLKKFGG